jgi:hypothetical protein
MLYNFTEYMDSFVSFYPLYLFLSLFRFVVYVMGLSLSIF